MINRSVNVTRATILDQESSEVQNSKNKFFQLGWVIDQILPFCVRSGRTCPLENWIKTIQNWDPVVELALPHCPCCNRRQSDPSSKISIKISQLKTNLSSSSDWIHSCWISFAQSAGGSERLFFSLARSIRIITCYPRNWFRIQSKSSLDNSL